MFPHLHSAFHFCASRLLLARFAYDRSDGNTDLGVWHRYRYTSMYLGASTNSHRVMPILPNFYLVHLIFRFFPSLDVLLRPVDMAPSVRDLDTKISITSKQCRCENIPCSA